MPMFFFFLISTLETRKVKNYSISRNVVTLITETVIKMFINARRIIARGRY